MHVSPLVHVSGVLVVLYMCFLVIKYTWNVRLGVDLNGLSSFDTDQWMLKDGFGADGCDGL